MGCIAIKLNIEFLMLVVYGLQKRMLNEVAIAMTVNKRTTMMTSIYLFSAIYDYGKWQWYTLTMMDLRTSEH